MYRYFRTRKVNTTVGSLETLCRGVRTQSVGRRFSSFEVRDSIHLRLAFGRVRRSAWRRAPSQKRLDSRRPVSVSCDVARTVGPRASGTVLPFVPRSTLHARARVCACVCVCV